jgi:hypothetical protein
VKKKEKVVCPKGPVNDSRFANMVWMEQRNRMNEGRRERRKRNQVEQRSESEACLGDEARNEEQEKGLRMYPLVSIFSRMLHGYRYIRTSVCLTLCHCLLGP